MKSFLASARAGNGLDRVDRDVDLLEEQWRRHGEVSLERFWQNCKAKDTGSLLDRLAHLVALIKSDLRCRFERGQTAEVAHYLDRFPDLRQDHSRVISLIYEEFCLREEKGDAPDVDTFCERYPAWKDSLLSQLQYHHLLSQAAGLSTPKARFPEAGDQFEEFELVSLIGKGGSSRVFLARDLSLGGKRVVLKVSLDRGQEPKTQGALDHPHIVPVNAVAFQPDQGLRGLSMPYRPGLPLDEIVKRVRPAERPKLARILWDVTVDGTSAVAPAHPREKHASLHRREPTGDLWNGFPVEGTYAQGAAWIAMILARALHYAHGMQTFHRDVKPGNILLTLDHGPQLLDFNLAESPHAAHQAESAMLGGTLPYMAPEQIEAFLNPDLWGKVGARADIYSLGLVLRELLTGQAPDLPDEKTPPARAMSDLLDRRTRLVTDVRQFNPQIPHALQAIVDRCLCFNPDDRYPDALSLVEDLGRFLTHQPLQLAVNPSRRERIGNWVTRNQARIVGHTVYLALIGILGYHWAAPMLKPDPATLPVIRQAVKDIDNGHAGRAIVPLRGLVLEYPSHPLPLTLLGIAQGVSHSLVEDDAQVSMNTGLNLPSAESKLLEWARENPSLARQLQDFVTSRIDLLIQYKTNAARRDSTGVKASPSTDEQGVERKYYETMLKVLALALKVDPESRTIRTQAARVEEFFGNYESAHLRLTELIDAARARGDRKDRDELIDWITRRSRVAIRWAAQLRRHGDAASSKRALALIEQAAKALGDCERVVAGLVVLPNRLNPAIERVYDFYWISSETWLAMGEIARDLGQHAQARSAFQNAKKAFDCLTAFSREHSLVHERPAEVETLWNRVRAGLLTQWPAAAR
ncbi:MAG: serine/threonine protein kinase [Isosphaeraceae bacterium]